MADSKSRDLETREKVARPKAVVYAPPSTLPFPDPEPGVVFRYVATHVLGQSDPSNVSKRFREGWEPCKAVDYPELMMAADANGNVEIGGLMLCKMAAEQAEARAEYYEQIAANQMVSVDNHFMRNNDPRMPLFRDSSSQVTRGRGFGTGTK